MFIILFIGFGCSKKGLITREGNKQLSAVALHIVNPLLIFMAYQTDHSSRLMKGLCWSFLLSAVSFGVMIGLSGLIVSGKREDFALERFSCVYSNCGFIGIPLIRGIYGDEGVLYLTAYITLFNILVWTHGYMTMKGQADRSTFFKALRAPSVVAVFLGFIFYLGSIRLPGVLSSSLQYVADMNTPLAMLIAGAAAAQTDFKKAVRNKGLYLVAAMKLLILPMAAFFIMKLFPAPALVLMTVTIAAACPVATTGTMFAIQMDKKPERCSEFFAVTTLLSALTLPLITALTGLMLA
ncbi:MAG: AEC family transporter [Ruminococcus sp.]|nr:AEC family transporter [Ruminococcus sp.]